MTPSPNGVTISDVRALVVAHREEMYRYLDAQFGAVKTREDDMLTEVYRVRDTIHEKIAPGMMTLDGRMMGLDGRLKALENTPYNDRWQAMTTKAQEAEREDGMASWINRPVTPVQIGWITAAMAGAVSALIWLINHGITP